MSGDTTLQALSRLSHLPGSTNPASLIAAQNYYDVEFVGGNIDGVNLGLNSPVNISPTSFDFSGFANAILYVDGAELATDENFNYGQGLFEISSGPSDPNSLFRIDVSGGVFMTFSDDTGNGNSISAVASAGGTSSMYLATYAGVSTSLHSSITLSTSGGTNGTPANVAPGTVVASHDFATSMPSAGFYGHIRVTASGTQSSTACSARMDFYTTPAGAKENITLPNLSLLPGGDVVANSGALATNATTGFFWIPSCPGAPTGAPTAPYTGAVGLVYDSTDNKIYARVGGAWKSVSLT